jgi:hypothetical protein
MYRFPNLKLIRIIWLVFLSSVKSAKLQERMTPPNPEIMGSSQGRKPAMVSTNGSHLIADWIIWSGNQIAWFLLKEKFSSFAPYLGFKAIFWSRWRVCSYSDKKFAYGSDECWLFSNERPPPLLVKYQFFFKSTTKNLC